MISAIGIVSLVVLFWADLEKVRPLKWFAAGICSVILLLEWVH